MMSVLGLLSVAVLIIWHRRQKTSHRKHLHELFFIDESDGNEKEKNPRRYRNPLFEQEKGGSFAAITTSTGSQEMIRTKTEKNDNATRWRQSELRVSSPSNLIECNDCAPVFKWNIEKNVNQKLEENNKCQGQKCKGQRSRVYASERELVV